jgi:hypothetical protein
MVEKDGKMEHKIGKDCQRKRTLTIDFHRLQIRMCVKKKMVTVGTEQYCKQIEGFTTIKKNVLESTSYLLLLAMSM